VSGFPVDEATLVMLAEACRINPDLGRTTLHDFLDMGKRVKTVSEGGIEYGSIDEALEAYEGDGPPILDVEHEPGFEPYSPNDVILALIAEIERLRACLDGAR
jgi:hypothetical protein